MRGKEAPITTCEALAAALLPVVASRLLEAPYVVSWFWGVSYYNDAKQQASMHIWPPGTAPTSCWQRSGGKDQPARPKLLFPSSYPALHRRSWLTAWAPGTLMSFCGWPSSKAYRCLPRPSSQVPLAACSG
jgi:hypothetical protein